MRPLQLCTAGDRRSRIMIFWFTILGLMVCMIHGDTQEGPKLGLHLANDDAALHFGPSAECKIGFEAGPPPKLVSSCTIEQPPSPPTSPPPSPPSAPPTMVYLGVGFCLGDGKECDQFRTLNQGSRTVSTEVCKQLCLDTSGCTAITHTNTNECVLHNILGTAMASTPEGYWGQWSNAATECIATECHTAAQYIWLHRCSCHHDRGQLWSLLHCSINSCGRR